ncbi:SusC/RagA family TonB-linked outer membrane protein [Chitinophaga sp. SYP-B3965]|uniref:SusC/RagA family TonB-linked outer membrane protein n=1 Tax=Chitinophaga sp. SYP-B3965 TaxID=2663120 RepID=UPI001299CC8E|nr:SusC/RagA family TonB-linked outer membrane protein [Chitinophaga sp. SYP-B3965]MRG48461.1 SusC/RagA family TonB-linked outer membrane protein [Chitinophaga sp. SYP-B3965]
MSTLARELFLVPKLAGAIILLLLSFKTYGQTGPGERLVTIKVTNTLKVVLDSIEAQTKLRFNYNHREVNPKRIVITSFDNMPVQKALIHLFNGTGLYWDYLDDNKVRISKKDKTQEGSSIPQTTADPPKAPSDRLVEVTHKVIDEENCPIIGASVITKKTRKATTTDNFGIFSLKDVMPTEKVRISYMGYETREVTIKDIRNEIRLAKKINTLKGFEVSSDGYQEKHELEETRSIGKLDNKLINRTTSANLLDRIINTAPGVANTSPDAGIPGRTPFSIRGNSTIYGNQYPLIIIDNFPYNEISTVPVFLNYLSPDDVESITILRDAAAAAIWGARSSNGVMVIKTKKGDYNQPMRILLNASLTIGERPDLSSIPQTSPETTVEAQQVLFNKGLYNRYDDVYPDMQAFPALPEVVELLLAARKGSISQADAAEKIAAYAKHDVRDDLNKYFLQNSVNRQYALSISGGRKRMHYFSSIGYNKSTSSAKGDESERFTFRFDNSFNPSSKLGITTYIAYTQLYTSRNAIPIGGMMPYSMLADAAGNSLAIPHEYRMAYVDTARYPSLMDWRYKPLDEQQFRDDKMEELDIRLGGAIKYTLLKGFTLDTRFQYQRSTGDTRILNNIHTFYTRNLINQFKGEDSSSPIPSGDVLDQTFAIENTINLRSQLTYQKIWGKNNELDVKAGVELSETQFNRTSSRQYGANNWIDFSKQYKLRGNQNITDQIPGAQTADISTINRFISYYAILSQELEGKYFADVTVRQDGANFFGVKANNQLIPLWSVGLGWNISKEDFYDIQWLDLLKIRTSYGYTGNMKNDISSHAIMEYSYDPQSLTGLRSASITTPPNPYLKWERSAIINIGIDFKSKGKRIEGSADWYFRDVKDLISPISIETTSGFSQYLGNAATMKGKGIDITLKTINIKIPFIWTTMATFSYNTDKVTGHNMPPTVANLLFGTSPNIGKPLYGIYSYKWGGLDSISGGPQGYVGNTILPYNFVMNGSNTKPEDLVYHGPSNPKFFGYVLNSFTWKRFTLSCNILYRFDYYFRRQSLSYSSLLMNGYGHSDYIYRWQKPGDELITNVPSMPTMFTPSRDNFYQRSEVTVEKADHIRLQDIRIDYLLPLRRINKLAKSTVNLYFLANNMGIIWRANKYNIDPASGENNMPVPRNYTLGANIKF